MRRLSRFVFRFLASIAVSIISVAVAEGITSGRAGAQGATIKHFVTPESSVSLVMPTVSRYIPDAVYEQWWQEIAACEHLPLPPAHYEVHWYQVNAPQFYDANHPTFGVDESTGEIVILWAVGISYVYEWQAYIALSQLFNPVVIKHEMLHFLLHWAGVPPGADSHPMPYFGRCGVTVTYQGP